MRNLTPAAKAIGGALLLGTLPTVAAQSNDAISSGIHISECYNKRWASEFYEVTRSTDEKSQEKHYCIEIDKSCSKSALNKIREKWINNSNDPLAPMQVYLELRLKYCKVENSDFIVPHDSVLHSLEHDSERKQTIRAVFSPRTQYLLPCVAQIWPSNPFALDAAKNGKTVLWNKVPNKDCELLKKEELPTKFAGEPNWISAHNQLIDMKLFPRIAAGKSQSFPANLNDLSTFDIIDIPEPPPSAGGTSVDPPPIDPATPGGPIRDAGIAGFGALSLLFARWLRELLLSRRKASPVTASVSEGIQRSDIAVQGRWMDDAAIKGGDVPKGPNEIAPG